MKVHPIMVSASMINALIAKRKTMTRRRAWNPTRATPTPTHWQNVKVGDLLWVREALVDRFRDKLRFMADNAEVDFTRQPDNYLITREMIPSMFMPRWASRFTLVVTATKIERLQMISEADALAEGVPGDVLIESTGERKPFGPCALMNFGKLWESLHGAGSWDENPEVVAMTFVVHQKHVDVMLKEAA